MAASKDPTFKLFGTAIPVLDLGKELDPEGSSESHEKFQDTRRDATHAEVENQMVVQTGLSNNWNFSSPLKGNKDVNPQNPRSQGNLQGNDQDQDSKEVVDHRAPHQESKQIVDPKPEEDLIETDESGQEKALKKPDKMLPCPRCNSLDTKFCYFNNYNVNQPRHFCKNCHRYWTAGGNMRNVPVGAGRRKNKHAASHYRHLMMSSDAISNTTVDAPHTSHHQVLTCGLSAPLRPVNCDPAVLKFGPDAPLCKSVENTLNLHDQKKNIETDHAPHGKNGGEPSCGSSLTTSNCLGTELPEHRDQIESGGLPGSYNGVILPHPMQCYGGPSWPHPWYPGWNNVAAMAAGGCSSELVYGPGNRSLNPVHWGPRPMMAPPPAFCAPNVPFPYVPVPASSWGWVPGWAGGPWKFPCASPIGGVSSTSSSSSGCSGNDSLTPGKHSRDGNLLGEEKLENYPETLKIPRTVDADDAAKSSIWVTLGRKTDQSESVSKGGINKSFQSKLEDDDHSSDASQVLQANPAALSRSQTFQESSI